MPYTRTYVHTQHIAFFWRCPLLLAAVLLLLHLPPGVRERRATQKAVASIEAYDISSPVRIHIQYCGGKGLTYSYSYTRQKQKRRRRRRV